MSHYNPSLAFTSTRRPVTTFRRNQNTVAFRSSKTLGPIAHTVMVALMLAVLGLIYLTQITKTSTYGYEINELQARRDALLSQKESLEVENARLQALERTQSSDVAKAMVRPEVTNYTN